MGAPPEMRRVPFALLAAALVYVAYRALVLHTAFDAVSIPAYEVTSMGNIAHIAVGGWRGAPCTSSTTTAAGTW